MPEEFGVIRCYNKWKTFEHRAADYSELLRLLDSYHGDVRGMYLFRNTYLGSRLRELREAYQSAPLTSRNIHAFGKREDVPSTVLELLDALGEDGYLNVLYVANLESPLITVLLGLWTDHELVDNILGLGMSVEDVASFRCMLDTLRSDECVIGHSHGMYEMYMCGNAERLRDVLRSDER